MTSLRPFLLLFIIVMSLAASLACNTAHAQSDPWQRCVVGDSCYASLDEAEDAINARALPDRIYKQTDVSVNSVGNLTLTYKALVERPPVVIGEKYYVGADWEGGGFASTSANCSGGCDSEDQLVARIIENHQARCVGCQVTYSMKGGYSTPPTYTRTNGDRAEVSFPYGDFRRIEALQGSSLSSNRITKYLLVQCEPGYLRLVDSPTGETPWDKLCATSDIAYVQSQLNQICSPAANPNPCYPLTGDKARFETDLVFSGRRFVRSYHSLELISHPTLAPGWWHTYAEKLQVLGNAVYGAIDESGYVDVYSEIATGTYQSQTHPGKRVKYSAGGFEMIGPSGERKDFDASGRLVRVRGSSNPLLDVELVYENDVLSEVKNVRGDRLTFVYELIYGQPRLASIAATGGEVVYYDYSEEGDLVSADYGSSAKSYLYNESGLSAQGQHHKLTGIVSETGVRYASFGYDARGRAILSKLHTGDPSAPNAGTTSLSYTSTYKTAVTQDTGVVRTYTTDGSSYRRLASIAQNGKTESNLYTSGWISQHYDYRGNLTRYTRDSSGNITELTDSDNVAASKRRTQIDWHPEFGLPVERRVYDSADVLVAKQVWTYNDRGQILTASSVDPVIGTSRTAATTYCEQADVTAGTCPLLGLVTSIDGPRTDVSDTATFTYYSSDEASCAPSPNTCPHRKGDLWKVQDALGNVTETLKYDGAGRVLSVKDANNVVTDLEYHARGWLTARKVRGADDAVETDDQITRIEYYPTGLVKKTTLPDGSYTSFTYDAALRLTDVTDGAGNKIHYTLDNAGNRTKEETFDSTSALARTLSRVYNQLGQLQTQKDAFDNATGFTYDADGNDDQATDAKGRVADNDYDPLNRLSKTIHDLGGIAATTQFKYDARDHLTEVIDPKNLSTKYTYNGLGDLTQLSSPDTGLTTYTYDSAGNRKTQTDARTKTATYSYDALNRLIAVVYPTTSDNITYTYDVASSVCATDERFAKGYVTKIVTGADTTQYCYDRFGQVTRKHQNTGGKVFVVRYAYTQAGQLKSITYPDASVVDYVRDTQGRTTQIGVTRTGQSRQVLLTSAGYYPFGPVSEWVFGNGRLFQRTLNQNYQPGVIVDANAGGLSLGYEFDTVGNLSKLRNGNQNDPPLRLFGHDGLNRLTSAQDGTTQAFTEKYGYDATGNRTSATVGSATTSYTYPATNHRLSKVGTVARTYDAIGNTTAIGSTTQQFVYNDAARMVTAKRNSLVVMNYRYNGKGEQVRRWPTDSATTSIYTVYDEAGHWLGEYDNAGAPLQQGIWLDDLPVGLTIGTVSANKPLHYIEADALGTPRTIIESQRNVAVWNWSLTGEAFGKGQPIQDADGDGTSLVFDLRFPGQRYDAASGLNQNGFRDYDAVAGRYAQSDPVGLLGGISTYGYALSNPLTWFDPDGMLALPKPQTPPAPRPGPGQFTPPNLPPANDPIYAPRRLWWPLAGRALAACTNPYVIVGAILMAVPNTTSACDTVNKMQPDECYGDDCDKQWRDARQVCRALIYEQMLQAAGRRKKRSVTGVTGRYTDVEECARGLVSERCGGNKVER